ncbi:hypothetical protein [Sessilibacter corallicola]|uniref:hypothetical protein n=1 Tax=Sessilibacter corallicola TaxID=2904075 RepID=UPI001E31E85E|nr:hypothetical protein [Sessilibacter corallicola]MCE2030390.1 hypothetical protein [Sessilibacter corallicola]
MPLDANVRSVVEKKLEEYEGRYNHMYLDTKGKVTVGVGHLIANKAAAAFVVMYTVKNGQPSTIATTKQKQDEYDVIAKQKKNYKASWYKQHTSLVMKDSDINAQRKKHIDTFYSELVGVYKKSKGYTSDFDDFPVEVQKALFDMIFNLGQTKLRNVFVNFNKAIKKEQWDVAAKQSNRPDVNAARNKYVRDLFNAAHASANKAAVATP